MFTIQNSYWGADFGRLIIASECRGKKYGYKATKDAIEIANRIGLHTIHLDVFEENKAAYKTYLKAGFHISGEEYVVRDKIMVSTELVFS